MTDKTMLNFLLELPEEIQRQAEEVAARMGYRDANVLFSELVSRHEDELRNSFAEAFSHYLEELEDELRWQVQFENSQDALDKLADEARAAYYAGETEEFDPDTDPEAL